MRKLLLIITMLVTLVSCETSEDVRLELTNLRAERTKLIDANYDLDNRRKSLTTEVEGLNESLESKLHEVGLLSDGQTPLYILEIRLKQSRVSLDLGKHMKDAMNTIKFTIPVSREFYESVNVGTELSDDFRAGSFIMNGTFSSWNMRVVNKSIQ